MKKRLTASEKRTWAILFSTQLVKGPLGKQEQKTKVGRVKGSYRKQRGGIVNHQTQEVSTAQVSFAIDYRAAFMNVNVVELNGQQYEVKDTTNVGFENHTIIFDLELAQS
ncbi:hypothetical protein AUR67_00620 [Pseudoalteromonas sp. XI10]|uniref:hypothetical protein n=1 Tax=Pseudoalteromonas sp. XI10 TaxID=1766621 RepID=UPI0007334125|nr:hypothetical protein [Pseudoalteromonas sp. XI10]KTG22015.1 hypothetical protein AUR67_00620 [Pseudoalteromonas sp. XI10]